MVSFFSRESQSSVVGSGPLMRLPLALVWRSNAIQVHHHSQ
jgi:hypothetical protein